MLLSVKANMNMSALYFLYLLLRNIAVMCLLPWHWRNIKNLNTFFKIINKIVDSTIATVDSTLVQESIRQLHNRRIDACVIVKSTLVHLKACKKVFSFILEISIANKLFFLKKFATSVNTQKNKKKQKKSLKNSINHVLVFIINELEFSSRCLGYRAMHQKFLMNGFFIDHDSVRLILKKLDPLSTEQRSWHSLTKCSYVSTGPNQTWHIDGYDKLKSFGFAIHGAIDGYTRKIL